VSETETRRGYARGRERREEILAAADAAFARHGFRGASLATIAEEVGLSQPGVLHHFPSKEHLLLEVLRYREERGLEYMERTVEETDSYAEALLELCAANAQTPGLVRLFTVLAAESVDDDHPANARFRARYRDLRRRVAARLAIERREGRLPGDADIDKLAPQVLAMLDGLQLQWLLDPGEVDMVALFRDFLERIGEE
jgi:AcrR family transcriptional regulator